MAKVLAETCCYICLQPKLVLSLLNPLPMRANACQPLLQLELPNRTHTKSTECIQGAPSNTRPGRQWPISYMFQEIHIHTVPKKLYRKGVVATRLFTFGSLIVTINIIITISFQSIFEIFSMRFLYGAPG